MTSSESAPLIKLPDMNSLKLIIPIVIIFILLGAGVYTIYKIQTGSPLELTSRQDFFPSASASASPNVQGVTTPPNQPATGQDELEIKNIGIQLATPTANQQISSPQKVAGIANVTSQTVLIDILDGSGKMLGQGTASACLGLDACQFEASITFTDSHTPTGTVVIYSPNVIDNSPTFVQSIPVKF